MTTIQAWLKAFRLRTLPLAFSSIFLGSFLAAKEGLFNLPILAFALLTTLFLQILSNLANDYGDFVKGTDNAARIGPARTVQSGLISPSSMKSAIYAFSLLAFGSGLALLYVSGAFSNFTILFFFLGLGGLCILAAITYTVGKNAYGYRGLGDISVLLFFGFVGVLGTYFLMTHGLNFVTILPALWCGLLATGVLNLNNLRDIQNDANSGKRSIPVLIGFEAGKIYEGVLIWVSVACLATYIFFTFSKLLQLLPAMLLPIYFLLNKQIQQTHEPRDLDKFLKLLALLSLGTTFLFGLSQLL